MTTRSHERDPKQAGLKSLSPSRASDFKRCPQLFKFSAIDRIKTPPTVYQARGTTAHLALERLFGLPAAERTPERLYDLFREAWQENKANDYPDLFDDVESERAWGIESLGILANYVSVEDPTFFALKIYALLIRIREGRTPAVLRLMYLTGPTVLEIPVDDDQLDAMQRELEALWAAIERAIETDDFPARTGVLCDWCSYQDICPAFADEEGSTV